VLSNVIRIKIGGEIFVENASGEAKIVIILPVSRIGSTYQRKWEKVIKLAIESKVAALVVIDKTQDFSATDYFLKNIKTGEFQLYLAEGSIEHSMYESQSAIKLGKNLWIIQLHDDDTWSGKLTLPKHCHELDVYPSKFKIADLPHRHSPEKDYPPKILFSLIPANIWNLFTNFIKAQGSHSAGSLDHTLTFITNSICAKKFVMDFEYVYNDDHWRSRSVATKYLLNLTKIDGWGKLSSIDIAMFNRTVDGITAMSYLKYMVGHEEYKRSDKLLYNMFIPSNKRKMYILVRLFLTIVLTKIDMYVSAVFKLEPKTRYLDELFKYSFLKATWKIRTSQDLIVTIRILIKDNSFPLLSQRFEFWISQLSEN
jgi:hypothetical protein